MNWYPETHQIRTRNPNDPSSQNSNFIAKPKQEKATWKAPDAIPSCNKRYFEYNHGKDGVFPSHSQTSATWPFLKWHTCHTDHRLKQTCDLLELCHGHLFKEPEQLKKRSTHDYQKFLWWSPLCHRIPGIHRQCSTCSSRSPAASRGNCQRPSSWSCFDDETASRSHVETRQSTCSFAHRNHHGRNAPLLLALSSHT